MDAAGAGDVELGEGDTIVTASGEVITAAEQNVSSPKTQHHCWSCTKLKR